MTKRVCLVTNGQPSTNPRLVKEADALVAAGCTVHVIGAHWTDWADRTDAEVISTRGWSYAVIDWRRSTAPWLFWKTRIRHAAARLACRTTLGRKLFERSGASRLTPELTTAAKAWPADLYIAHNLGALPAAAAAAAQRGARLGFDAEDFHSGQLLRDDRAGIARTQAIESAYLHVCDYVTAASPGIAAAYAKLCRHPPVVVLNVFPLADRPAAPAPPASGVFRLYWFSQTIGRDRGLEAVAQAMGQLSAPVELHLRGQWQAGFEHELRAIAQAAGLSATQIVHHAPAAPGEMVRLAAPYHAGLALETGRTPNSAILLSNKMFTYLLAGIPILVSPTAAQASLVRELGAAGVAVADPAAIARALRGWIERPDLLANARREAWQLGSTRFNWDAEQATFLSVVRSVFRDEGGRSSRVRGLAS